MKLFKMLEKIEKFGKKESPAILAGMAVVGLGLTVWQAYKSRPAVEKAINEYKSAQKREEKLEGAKKVVVAVAPTALTAAGTIGCIIGSHSISSRRIAVLSAAYNLSSETAKSLSAKMEEMVGEKKASEIKEAVLKDKFKKQEAKDQNKVFAGDGNLILPDNGLCLCRDLYSGRCFYSTPETIKRAVLKISGNVTQEMWVSLNDLYSEIGSPQLPQVPMGDDIGWGTEDLVNFQIPVVFTSTLTEDDRPCFTLDLMGYSVNPDFHYR